MRTARIWLIRIVIVALLIAAAVKSPTAFVSALFGVILAVYLIFLWIKWKFWRIVSPLQDFGKTANEVTLKLFKTSRKFHNAEQVNASIAILERQGFSMLGTFTARQFSTANIVVGNNQVEGISAIIMDIQYLGVTTEFCTRYEDGSSFTFSNTKIPDVLPRPVNHPIKRLPKAEVQEIFNEFKSSRPASGIYKISDAEIISNIEGFYSELKAYQLETIENTVSIEKELLENFIVKSGWSAIDWHRKQNDIVIIHDKIKDYDLIGRYESLLDTDGTQYQDLKGRVESIIRNHTPIAAFEKLSAEIPTKQRLEKILELSEPIPAHVYIKKVEHSSPSEV